MRADVLALASTLATAQSDPLTVGAYYDDAMTALAKAAWFIDVTLIPLTLGQATVEPPAPTVRIAGVVYDDRDLAATDFVDLETLSPHWRDLTGTPYAYTMEAETTATFRMIPVPTVPSKAFSFIHGEAVGVDYPAYVVATFLCQAPVDVPRWMDLPLALGILGREFGRDSAHADPVFAAACTSLGMLLFGAVSFDAS